MLAHGSPTCQRSLTQRVPMPQSPPVSRISNEQNGPLHPRYQIKTTGRSRHIAYTVSASHGGRRRRSICQVLCSHLETNWWFCGFVPLLLIQSDHLFKLIETCCFELHASWHWVCRLRIRCQKLPLLQTFVQVVHEARRRLEKLFSPWKGRSGAGCHFWKHHWPVDRASGTDQISEYLGSLLRTMSFDLSCR